MGTIVKPTGISFNDGTVQSTAAQGFPPGTAILFVQSTAPTGWTKSTTHNDKALRVVSGSVSSGGSVPFSSAMTNKSMSIGGTTLSINQMPSHNHTWTAVTAAVVGQNTYYRYNYGYTSITGGEVTGSTSGDVASQGGGQSHTHSISNIDMNIQYIDVIICTKD